MMEIGSSESRFRGSRDSVGDRLFCAVELEEGQIGYWL